jgi:hypothetical protein
MQPQYHQTLPQNDQSRNRPSFCAFTPYGFFSAKAPIIHHANVAREVEERDFSSFPRYREVVFDHHPHQFFESDGQRPTELFAGQPRVALQDVDLARPAELRVLCDVVAIVQTQRAAAEGENRTNLAVNENNRDMQ